MRRVSGAAGPGEAINDYYQRAKCHPVNFLEQFEYGWSDGRLYALSG
ncbi:MAG: hypothetical protein H0T45_17620 [Pyrinomonadaceae bacterium]|nr:hypothetical protein [Pyrinomonadaceae bacterium]MDQ3134010.1 hypothetical protein [Acidobacteriota bacterium]